jgi:Tfp pilus assembly protein PilN
MTFDSLRFAFLTLFAALASVVAGGALIYVLVLAWQAGEIRAKGGMILASTSPIQFYLLMGCGSLFSLCLILASPFMCVKAFAPAEERARIAQLNPKIYKPVRLSLRIGFLFVVVILTAAWLAQ